MECGKLAMCPFFNDRMANGPATASLLKEKYCRGDFVNCARFMVLGELGPAGVPEDLFPHQTERARKLLGGKKNGDR
jgi:methyl-accepting chemotaxis protein